MPSGPEARSASARVTDVPFTGEEDEHVTGPATDELADGVADRLVEITVAICVVLVDRSVPDLDRVRPAGDLHHRRAEVVGEPFGVDRRRSDDHLRSGRWGRSWVR